MKLIFDFDYTLFDSSLFKDHIFETLEQAGIGREVSQKYYNEVRENQFSLKNYLRDLGVANEDKVYETIMNTCPGFVKIEMLEIAKSLGIENCYIATNGDKDFQMAKIDRCGIASLFQEIYITPGSKKEFIERICEKFPNEKVIFADDRQRFFEDLNTEKYPNLKTILFDEHGLEKLKKEISS
jgi:FMN phosphatase YigB (HAD superfamily)